MHVLHSHLRSIFRGMLVCSDFWSNEGAFYQMQFVLCCVVFWLKRKKPRCRRRGGNVTRRRQRDVRLSICNEIGSAVHDIWKRCFRYSRHATAAWCGSWLGRRKGLSPPFQSLQVEAATRKRTRRVCSTKWTGYGKKNTWQLAELHPVQMPLHSVTGSAQSVTLQHCRRAYCGSRRKAHREVIVHWPCIHQLLPPYRWDSYTAIENIHSCRLLLEIDA